jgi:hypothetical protein
MKLPGKPDAGKPPVRFEVAGAGNGTEVTAPVLDPTLGVAEQTLAIWKTTGRYSLPVVKIGRLAKYRKSDLDAFIANRTQIS